MRTPETAETSATYAGLGCWVPARDCRRKRLAECQADAPGGTRKRCATGGKGQVFQDAHRLFGGAGRWSRTCRKTRMILRDHPHGSGNEAAESTHVSGDRTRGLAITGRVPNAARRIDPPAMTEHPMPAVRGRQRACRPDTGDADGVPSGRSRRRYRSRRQRGRQQCRPLFCWVAAQ